MNLHISKLTVLVILCSENFSFFQIILLLVGLLFVSFSWTTQCIVQKVILQKKNVTNDYFTFSIPFFVVYISQTPKNCKKCEKPIFLSVQMFQQKGKNYPFPNFFCEMFINLPFETISNPSSKLEIWFPMPTKPGRLFSFLLNAVFINRNTFMSPSFYLFYATVSSVSREFLISQKVKNIVAGSHFDNGPQKGVWWNNTYMKYNYYVPTVHQVSLLKWVLYF